MYRKSPELGKHALAGNARRAADLQAFQHSLQAPPWEAQGLQHDDERFALPVGENATRGGLADAADLADKTRHAILIARFQKVDQVLDLLLGRQFRFGRAVAADSEGQFQNLAEGFGIGKETRQHEPAQIGRSNPEKFESNRRRRVSARCKRRLQCGMVARQHTEPGKGVLGQSRAGISPTRFIRTDGSPVAMSASAKAGDNRRRRAIMRCLAALPSAITPIRSWSDTRLARSSRGRATSSRGSRSRKPTSKAGGFSMTLTRSAIVTKVREARRGARRSKVSPGKCPFMRLRGAGRSRHDVEERAGHVFGAGF